MSSRSRVNDWDRKTPEQWRELVTHDLDSFDGQLAELARDLVDAVREMRAEIERSNAAVRADVGEVKESNKWVQRTLIGLLVTVLMMMAGVVATLAVPG